MKYFVFFAWCAAISIAGGQASQLSEQERETYLQYLKELREEADSKLEARYRVAINAYRAAMGSDEAALTLYMNCVEKVDFTDRNRRSNEFREWRRSNDARLKDAAFRRALRHQLRWLVLTLQATSEKADRAQLASGAQEIIDSIVNDASNLTGHQNILNQAVAGTVFTRAYEIGNIDVEDWVMAPGQIGAVYDQIIMPPYRETRRADALRASWIKRIQQQTRLVEEWQGESNERSGRIGMASAQRSAEFENFISDEVPRLQWRMEVDVFKHGDPSGAASRMWAHVGRNTTHPNVREWLNEFEGLLYVREVPVSFPDSWDHDQPNLRPERSQPSTPVRPPPPPESAPSSTPSNPDTIIAD